MRYLPDGMGLVGNGYAIDPPDDEEDEIAQLRAELALLKSERDAVTSPCPSCAGDAGHESGGPEGWIADECTCHPLRQENERLKADLQIAEFERDAAVGRGAVYRGALQDLYNDAHEIMNCNDVAALLANSDPAAQALLRDRERLNDAERLSIGTEKVDVNSWSATQIDPETGTSGPSFYAATLREAIDAAITASLPATEAEENLNA